MSDQPTARDLQPIPPDPAPLEPAPTPDDRNSDRASDRTQRQRAFSLYCRGLRSPAIAAQLNVSERTIRAWLKNDRETAAADLRLDANNDLLRAIETQRIILQAALDGHDNECALDRAILDGRYDHIRRRAIRRGHLSRILPSHPTDAPTDDEGILEEYERPHRVSHATRYLAIAAAAQREIARLLGLYQGLQREPAPINITITRRPDGPENIPPAPHPAPTDQPAPAAPQPSHEIPAIPAIASAAHPTPDSAPPPPRPRPDSRPPTTDQ